MTSIYQPRTWYTAGQVKKDMTIHLRPPRTTGPDPSLKCTQKMAASFTKGTRLIRDDHKDDMIVDDGAVQGLRFLVWLPPSERVLDIES